MKKLLLLFLPLMLSAQTYEAIIASLDRALALKEADYLHQAADKMAKAAKGANLPHLNAHLGALYLQETPTMILHFPSLPFPSGEVPMGTKEQWQGDLTLSYPLFTGFALSASIDKARYAAQMAKLKYLDLKRNLYLQATQLATSVYALKKVLHAKTKAKEAVEKAYKKAQGLFDNGLLPPADLYNIQAQKYAIEAQITETKSQMAQLLNQLSYLLSSPIDSVEGVGERAIILDKDILLHASRGREDMQALQKSLAIQMEDIKLAKSTLYPQVGLAAAIKKQGDSLRLNGDGYRNADQSYIGAQMAWNLFDGFGDQQRIEAAKAKVLATKSALLNYRNKIETELENAFLQLSSLQDRTMSASMQTKARQAYYKLTEGRFENQLASADELSRAIADLAAAKAQVAALQAQIFNQKVKILLLAGLKKFEQAFSPAKKSSR